MVFQVRLSEAAKRDLDAILDWLTQQHAGRAGINWFLTLEDAIASLANMPSRCPLAPENDRVAFEMRQLAYGRRPHVYRVLFVIEEDEVRILRVRHARRRRLQ